MSATPTPVEPNEFEPVLEPLSKTVDPDEFTPRLLALLSNALVWRESHQLRQRFGLGTNDWRVISALAIRPGMNSTEIGEFIGLNKAIISKSVNLLAGRGIVVLADGPRGSRPLYLTRIGVELHDPMLEISLSGQRIVLEGLDADQITRLNAVLRQMLANIRAIQPASGDDETTDDDAA